LLFQDDEKAQKSFSCGREGRESERDVGGVRKEGESRSKGDEQFLVIEGPERSGPGAAANKGEKPATIVAGKK